MKDAEAGATLARLLGDENLAVVRRTTACLLGQPTAKALQRFTATYAIADNQIGDAMKDELRVAVVTNPAFDLRS
jgi:hypothetical protein